MKIGTIQSLACVGLGALLGFLAATRGHDSVFAGRRGSAPMPAGRGGDRGDRARRLRAGLPAVPRASARRRVAGPADPEDDK